MYQTPKTYEEAKKVLVDSTNDKMTKRYLNMQRAKALFVTVLGTGAIYGIGALTGLPTPIEYVLPAAGFFEFTGLLPVIQKRIVNGKMKNGSYFEGRSEEEIMDMAKSYVATANEFEKMEQNRKK